MSSSTITAGPAVSAGPAPAPSTGGRHAARRRSASRSPCSRAPRSLVYVDFVLLPVGLAAVYSFFNWNGFGPLTRLHRPRQLRAGAQRPGLHRRHRPQPLHRRALPAHPGPDRDRRRAAAQPPDARPHLLPRPHLHPLRAERGHRGLVLEAAAAAGRPVRQLPHGDRPRRLQASSGSPTPTSCSGPCSAILTWKYIGFAIILFLAGLQGVPDELERGGRHRRRQLVADPAPHHDPAARPDHPHLGVPVDHRIAAAVRHGLGPHRRRPGRRHGDDGDLHGPVRIPAHAARLRQRRRRHPVRHLVRLRPASTSASCSDATSRARSPKEWVD